MKLVTFTELAGVPVHYDRMKPPFQYGTRGKPLTFRADEGFLKKLEACFGDIWRELGKAEVITTAGAYVNKPHSMHNRGRAFDLDGIFWSDKKLVTAGFYDDPKLYLTVEAVLRKHFGTVLGYFYNPAHRDHFHFDDGSKIGFSISSRSRMLFVQAFLKFSLGKAVALDGRTIPLGSFDKFMEVTPWSWTRFLDYTIRELKGSKAAIPEDKEGTPLDLLHDVYEAVREELQDTSLRKPIELALNRFANNEEVQEWLKQFKADEDVDDS